MFHVVYLGLRYRRALAIILFGVLCKAFAQFIFLSSTTSGTIAGLTWISL